MKILFQTILATFGLSTFCVAVPPAGICLHAYGPGAPEDKIECFEFAKSERTTSGIRYFAPNGGSEIVSDYRARGVVLYPRSLQTGPEELARLLDVYTKRAQQSPSTRPFLNPWIIKIQETQAENAKREERISQIPAVTLADGTVLKDCKIKRIEGSFVYLSYMDGVKKVDIAQLSDAAKKSLHFDSVPKELVKSAEQPKREARELADAQQRREEAATTQTAAEIVSAGRGIMGKNATESDVLGMVSDVFGEDGSTSGGETVRRLHKIQSLAAMANLDSKFVAEFVKVMRKTGENMGMTGLTAAAFAINSVESSIQIQKTAGANGSGITLIQAQGIAGAPAAVSAGSGGATIFDAFQVALGQYTSADRCQIDVKGVGTLEDVYRQIDAVKNFNPADPKSRVAARNGFEYITKYSGQIHNGISDPSVRASVGRIISTFLTDTDPEYRDNAIAQSGGVSVNTIFAKGFNPVVEEKMAKNGGVFTSLEMLHPLAGILTNETGDKFKLFNQFFDTDKGREYTKRWGLGKENIGQMVRSLSTWSQSFNDPNLGMKSIAQAAAMGDIPRVAKEQEQLEINSAQP